MSNRHWLSKINFRWPVAFRKYVYVDSVLKLTRSYRLLKFWVMCTPPKPIFVGSVQRFGLYMAYRHIYKVYIQLELDVGSQKNHTCWCCTLHLVELQKFPMYGVFFFLKSGSADFFSVLIIILFFEEATSLHLTSNFPVTVVPVEFSHCIRGEDVLA